MARYVIFPGTAGSYADTADINLMDADSAHLQQSVGDWVPNSVAVSSIVLSAEVAPVFGDFEAKVAFSTVITGTIRTGAGVLGFPVVASTAYTFNISAGSLVREMNVRVRIRWSDAGGATLTTPTPIDYTAVPVNGFLSLSAAVTSPVDAAFFMWIVDYETRDGGNFVSATDFGLFDACCLRAGTDTTFVPSLDIVGTLFEAFNSTPDDPPIAYAADGTPLTVGVSWAGNLYTYSRHDGADASAPIVAIFDAEDIGL